MTIRDTRQRCCRHFSGMLFLLDDWGGGLLSSLLWLDTRIAIRADAKAHPTAMIFLLKQPARVGNGKEVARLLSWSGATAACFSAECLKWLSHYKYREAWGVPDLRADLCKLFSNASREFFGSACLYSFQLGCLIFVCCRKLMEGRG